MNIKFPPSLIDLYSERGMERFTDSPEDIERFRKFGEFVRQGNLHEALDMYMVNDDWTAIHVYNALRMGFDCNEDAASIIGDWCDEMAESGNLVTEADLMAVQSKLNGLVQLPKPTFPNVSCSQCGRDFGPGEHGFSHCKSHSKLQPVKI